MTSWPLCSQYPTRLQAFRPATYKRRQYSWGIAPLDSDRPPSAQNDQPSQGNKRNCYPKCDTSAVNVSTHYSCRYKPTPTLQMRSIRFYLAGKALLNRQRNKFSWNNEKQNSSSYGNSLPFPAPTVNKPLTAPPMRHQQDPKPPSPNHHPKPSAWEQRRR